MKKLVLLSLIIIIAIKALAQSTSGGTQKLHFGLKAAPSLAWLRTDSKIIKSDGTKFGFNYGLITEFNFAANYAFATGIDVAYRGGKFISTTDSSKTNLNLNLQYVELPLTMKFKTNEIGYLTYYLQIGLAPGINIRAKADSSQTIQYSSMTASSSSSDNNDIKNVVNNFNLSMIIGGGIEYSLTGNTVLLAGITFNNGFLDVLDNKEKTNSNYLALTIGILF